MEEAKHRSFRRSMLFVVLLSVIYAIIGNTFYSIANRYSAVIDMAYTISILLTVLQAVPVVLWFRNKYWYFPLFIPVLWVPMAVIASFLFSSIFPASEDEIGGGILMVFIYGLNLGTIVIGVLLGIVVNAAYAAWGKFRRE